MKLSIAIVSWNTHVLLAECLASIISDLQGPLGRCTEIIVVDNASTDGSSDMVRNCFPQVCLIQNKQNVGFAAANNQAIRHSTGDYILLLNSDTVVKPGALPHLVNYLDEHGEVGAAGARLLNSDGSLQISCYPAPSLSRELWRLFHLDRFRPYGVYDMAAWELDRPRPVDNLLGACILVRRSILESVGLLDEDYFMYSEEIDLCYRIRQDGWSISWVPQAQIIHHGGQSTRQIASEMFLRLYSSKLRYFSKFHGRMTARLYKLVIMLAAMSRLLLVPLIFVGNPINRPRRLGLAGNYARLLFALPGM